MLRAEGHAIESTLREIAADQKQQQTEERVFWARQVGTARGLNWITGLGALVGIVGLIFVGLSLRVTQQAAEDGSAAARAATGQAKTLADQEIRQLRAYLYVETEKLNDQKIVRYNAANSTIGISLRVSNAGTARRKSQTSTPR